MNISINLEKMRRRSGVNSMLIVLLSIAVISTALAAEQNSWVMAVSDINWQALNPVRGEKGPKAGVLWGDLRAEVPTGFLAKFTDGFSSPSHGHNVSYRAVVISGEIHNDDPDAFPMWMTPGSFWTQPKGQRHITAAKGENAIALVEIDIGPYLVIDEDMQADSLEKPINIDASNLVWVNYPSESISDDTVKVAYLWSDASSGTYGNFYRLPPAFEAKIDCANGFLHGVIIKGKPDYHGKQYLSLLPGSYFGSEGSATHILISDDSTATEVYLHSNSECNITEK